jgi:hypothetical protein
LETGIRNEPLDRPIEMTAAAEGAPRRRQAMLPLLHAKVGRQPVLDKEESATGFEHPAHLPQSARDMIDRA